MHTSGIGSGRERESRLVSDTVAEKRFQNSNYYGGERTKTAAGRRRQSRTKILDQKLKLTQFNLLHSSARHASALQCWQITYHCRLRNTEESQNTDSVARKDSENSKTFSESEVRLALFNRRIHKRLLLTHNTIMY
jgi:hypothetical protein